MRDSDGSHAASLIADSRLAQHSPSKCKILTNLLVVRFANEFAL